MPTKHNCCMKNIFEWKSIDILGKTPDVIGCVIYGRTFAEVLKGDENED